MTSDLSDIQDRIDQCLGDKDDVGLYEELVQLTDAEIVSIINNLRHGKKKIFRFLDVPTQQEIIWEIDNFSRNTIINGLTVSELIDLLVDMDSDDASDIVSLIHANKRKVVLANLPAQDEEDIRSILQYGEDTAGHIMQTELIRVPESFTVHECIRRIQRNHKEVKKIDSVFVTDGKGILLGYIPIEQLIIQPPQTKVESILREATSIPVTMDQEQVVALFKDADLSTLPVVDENGKLLGRITSDDIVDVLEEEQGEDIYGLGGVSSEESISDPLVMTARRRLVWLVINLGTAIMAAATVGLFQDTIQKMVILAAYMPIVAGMGGNAATQTITVIVRGMALGEVQKRNIGKIFLKEIGMSILNGIVLGIIIGLLSFGYNERIMLGVVVALAMVANTIIAGTAGTLVPLFLKLVRLDPAVSSAVITTTCTDVGGFFVFLSLAKLLL